MYPLLEGKGCYIQIPGGKCNTRIKHLAKLLFENKGETKDFISQTKAKGVGEGGGEKGDRSQQSG